MQLYWRDLTFWLKCTESKWKWTNNDNDGKWRWRFSIPASSFHESGELLAAARAFNVELRGPQGRKEKDADGVLSGNPASSPECDGFVRFHNVSGEGVLGGECFRAWRRKGILNYLNFGAIFMIALGGLTNDAFQVVQILLRRTLDPLLVTVRFAQVLQVAAVRALPAACNWRWKRDLLTFNRESWIVEPWTYTCYSPSGFRQSIQEYNQARWCLLQSQVQSRSKIPATLPTAWRWCFAVAPSRPWQSSWRPLRWFVARPRWICRILHQTPR